MNIHAEIFLTISVLLALLAAGVAALFRLYEISCDIIIMYRRKP